MNNSNLIILIGNVGQDPDIKRFDNGGMVAKFSLATSETYKNRAGEKVTETDWHNIVVNSPARAEVVEKYVKKGDKLNIVGTVKYRKYTAKDGTERQITEIKCESLLMLPSGVRKDDDAPVSPSEGEAPAFGLDGPPF